MVAFFFATSTIIIAIGRCGKELRFFTQASTFFISDFGAFLQALSSAFSILCMFVSNMSFRVFNKFSSFDLTRLIFEPSETFSSSRKHLNPKHQQEIMGVELHLRPSMRLLRCLLRQGVLWASFDPLFFLPSLFGQRVPQRRSETREVQGGMEEACMRSDTMRASENEWRKPVSSRYQAILPCESLCVGCAAAPGKSPVAHTHHFPDSGARGKLICQCRVSNKILCVCAAGRSGSSVKTIYVFRTQVELSSPSVHARPTMCSRSGNCSIRVPSA